MLKNLKMFNEMNGYSNPKVWKVDVFDISSSNIIRQQLRKGLQPYYLNDYILEIIPTNKEGFPVKEYSSEVDHWRHGKQNKVTQKSLKFQPNKFGLIYFLTEEEVKELEPLTSKIKNIIKLMEEKKDLFVQLIGSKIQEM